MAKLFIEHDLKSLDFGDKFTLHPKSQKTWVKGNRHIKPDGTIVRIECHRINDMLENIGEAYFDPNHTVYKDC